MQLVYSIVPTSDDIVPFNDSNEFKILWSFLIIVYGIAKHFREYNSELGRQRFNSTYQPLIMLCSEPEKICGAVYSAREQSYDSCSYTSPESKNIL